MAKQRYINTRFWSDTYVSNLDPIEKLLFLYLLTNERTNICGIYELPLKIMSVETGIEKEMIEKIFARFEKDNKVFYRSGWIQLVNFTKHQDFGNPKIKKGIEMCLCQIPPNISQSLYSMDSLYIAYGYPLNNINNNSNSNINSNKKIKAFNNQIIPLKDGTKAKNYFGTWVDATNNAIKLDIKYYPELKQYELTNN
jgi:hypothetical protein